MATQGQLANLKPAANTNTLFYSSPIDSSASTVLTVANDGTASTYAVAVKHYDQRLVLDASTYKLHKGDLVSNYRFDLNANFDSTASITAGTVLTSADREKTAKFESFYVPDFTEVFVKAFAIRVVTLQSVSGGSFAVGNTLTIGTAPNTSTAVVYDVTTDEELGTTTVKIGPTTVNGTGGGSGTSGEFADGDVLSNGTASGTIASGGIGAAANGFVFSTTTSGGTYQLGSYTQLSFFGDRAYRFNVSDSTMSGRDFKLSTTTNGEYGPDGDASTAGDNGTEFTTGKTSNGTAGSSGAYVQYNFGASAEITLLYFYDGGTGTAANSAYGGADRYFQISDEVEYSGIYVYDVTGTWTSSDTFTVEGTTYTTSTVTTGQYGYVYAYSSTNLDIILGPGSAAFSGSETFFDVPALGGASRSKVTVSSIGQAQTALSGDEYLAQGAANANNAVAKITSLVVGPGERVIINSTTQNNTFTLMGFEDLASSFPVKKYDRVAPT